MSKKKFSYHFPCRVEHLRCWTVDLHVTSLLTYSILIGQSITYGALIRLVKSLSEMNGGINLGWEILVASIPVTSENSLLKITIIFTLNWLELRVNCAFLDILFYCNCHKIFGDLMCALEGVLLMYVLFVKKCCN